MRTANLHHLHVSTIMYPPQHHPPSVTAYTLSFRPPLPKSSAPVPLDPFISLTRCSTGGAKCQVQSLC